MALSNLDSFLECSTPKVCTQFFPEWESLPHARDGHFFVLEDLWDFYDEWSAYGRGVPIRLNDGEKVVQYFAPYLSALQIYAWKSPDSRISSSEQFGYKDGVDEMFLESETESTSSDYEEGPVLSRTNSNSSNKIWDSDDSCTDQDVELKMGKRLGKLYCQHFEDTSPYNRLPFRDMIKKLAEENPGLNSFRSIDLSPASWMAIAWYPIYHLPAQRNPKDLSSAFLTFHLLSSSSSKVGVSGESLSKRGGSETVSLPPFGMAIYRMQRQVWIRPKTEDSEKLNSLLAAATSWLTQVDAFHPDFSFFLSR